MHTECDARRRDAKKMEPGPILLLVVSCVAHCLQCEQSVATIGYVPPNLLRFLRLVWCAWGLRAALQTNKQRNTAITQV